MQTSDDIPNGAVQAVGGHFSQVIINGPSEAVPVVAGHVSWWCGRAARSCMYTSDKVLNDPVSTFVKSPHSGDQ